MPNTGFQVALVLLTLLTTSQVQDGTLRGLHRHGGVFIAHIFLNMPKILHKQTQRC